MRKSAILSASSLLSCSSDTAGLAPHPYIQTRYPWILEELLPNASDKAVTKTFTSSRVGLAQPQRPSHPPPPPATNHLQTTVKAFTLSLTLSSPTATASCPSTAPP